MELVSGGPAAKAGLKGCDHLRFSGGRFIPSGGDVITSIDGTPTSTLDEFNNILYQKKIGENVRLGIVRSGKQMTVDVATMADPGARS